MEWPVVESQSHVSEHTRKRTVLDFLSETRGRNVATTGKLFCNKAVYSLFRMFRKVPSSGTVQTLWHWSRYPFSLRGKALWCQSMGGWFIPENEAAIECMLHMEGYEPVEWVAPKEGDVFLDIGAFVGWHSIRAGRVVGPSGRVISLEPDPINRRQLEANLALNAIANCKTIPLAAWSKSGEELGWYTEKSPDCCRVDEAGHSATVRTTTVDDLVNELHLGRVDWIKMDIEGAEIEALKGAEKTLLQYRPRLFVEVHDTVVGVKELLARYNYSIEREAFDGSPRPHGWYLASAS
jgi:FkbM family methyltransferase